MKKYFVLMLLAAVISAVSAGENLLTYGEFSQDDLKQWFINSRQRPFKPYAIKDGILTGKTAKGMVLNEFISISRDIPALEKNAVYEFGGKVRIKAAPAKDKLFRLAIREVNAQGRSLRYYDLKPMLTADGEWIELSAEFTARPMAAKHQFYIVMANFAPEDQIEIDYIFVRKVDAVPAAADGNLVKNGDFESGVVGWACGGDPFRRSTTIAFDEECGKVLRLTGDVASKVNKFKNVYQALPALEKGRNYTLTFDLRSEFKSGTKLRFGVYVREVNNKQRTIRYVGKFVTATQQEWKSFEHTFTPAKNAAGAMLYITCENLGDNDVAMVDNIKLIAK